MCGIVGVINAQVWSNSKDFLKAAIIADTIRGPHSTGVFWVNKKDECWFNKQQVTGAEFAFSTHFQNATSGQEDPKFICGHNRWATKGAVNRDNAHPFSHHGVTGVHNGTLDTYDGLIAPPEHKGTVETAFGTDSETIYYTLSQADDPKEVLRELDGAFTLVWHDVEDNCVRMIRNSKRPLWIAKIQNRDTLVFASEKGIIEWAVGRQKYSNQIEWIKELPTEELWRFDLSRKGAEVIKPYVQSVKLKVPYSYSYNYGSRAGNYAGSYSSTLPPLNNGGSGHSHSETVGEYLRRHKLDRGTDLYAEVVDVTITGNSVRVVSVCELGSEPINTVVWLNLDKFKDCWSNTTNIRNLVLKEIGWTIGEANGMAKVSGESAVVLKNSSVQIMDHGWQMLHKGEQVGEPVKKDNILSLEHKLKEKQEKDDDDSAPFDDDLPDGAFSPDTWKGTALLGPHAVYIPRDEWFELTAEGCASCHGHLTPDEAELLEWDDENRPTCHHCQGVAIH